MGYIELSPSVAGGTGDVVGPASSVANRIASFSGTTGKLIQDSGVLSANVVQGPASSVADRIATYSDTTGKLIKDSGTLISGLATTASVPGPATVAPLADGTAAVGTTTKYAREDHRHPTDTAIATGDALRVLKAGDTMTGALTVAGKVVSSSTFAPTMFAYNTTDANGYGFHAQSNLMNFAKFDSAGSATATLGFFNAAGDLTVTGFVAAAAHAVSGAPGFAMAPDATTRSYSFIAGCNIRFLTTDSHMYFANGSGDGFRLQNDGNILMLNGKLPYRPGGGPWLDNSDERIKNVIGDYEHGLDEILTLQPVRYTFKGNNTGPDTAPSGLLAGTSPKEGETPPQAVVPYANSPHYTQAKDATEFIGLIAQAVEPVMPEMVAKHAAMIDGQPVTDLRTLDTGPLVFALINAVKMLAARVDALEEGGVTRAKPG